VRAGDAGVLISRVDDLSNHVGFTDIAGNPDDSFTIKVDS
jgi:hypothetical protein